jgi:glycosyltransferase involved in cell wall biosynthesis
MGLEQPQPRLLRAGFACPSTFFPPAPVIGNSRGLLESARRHLAEQRPLEAAKAYAGVLAQEPDCVEAHGQLGFLFLQSRQFRAALACLQQAARLAPQAPKLNLLMGAVLRELGQLEESAACCRREIELSPLDADAYFNLGRALQSLARPGEAMESFKQAVRLRPGYADAVEGVETARRDLIQRTNQSTDGDAHANSPDSGFNHVRTTGFPEAMPLYYSGQPGSGFGWGVCNRHLMEELSRLLEVRYLGRSDPLFQSKELPGDLFTSLGGHVFTPFSAARGRHNLGYVFFENELVSESVENARRFDVVFAGSTWCLERLQEKGISNTALLIQGVDTTVFHPETAARGGPFVLFSGGKFEYRKGQDLVLKAFSVLSKKHPDMVLLTAWHNPWRASMETMRQSPHIRFEMSGRNWVEQMEHIYRLNGIDPKRVVTMPSLPADGMARAYRQSDLGLFPNRCEGGTNLVLMEYMACGKPAIVTDATGHKDLCRESNAFLLKNLRPLAINDRGGKLAARWVEPSLDEIIAGIEFACEHRAEAQARGQTAAEDMKQWPWKRAAETVISTMSQLERSKKGPLKAAEC